ncbi:MAG TPA: pyridoxamine 5'-phosphate oxidase family protein [Ilumatobacteraceae bacterium]|jgi:nitroimidazol reductase NimA-like FMN-containing flavoprotein (pyridoxamine 5'-phosphate oxidase superfamily)|nr:pyridoxamine 5'-phosphate oxidase family protein [Ilumatobacteraceae bacterium]
MNEHVVNYDDLEESVCWRLVARVAVGRVGFVYDGEPMVLPVNSALVDGKIAFRTAGDSMLHDLGDGVRVAFEADHVDPVSESGWSVLVRGNLWEVTDEDLLGRLTTASAHPWAPGPKDRWMVIVPSAVSGRSITRHD